MLTDDLPDLTPQRHKFVQGLLQDMTATDAYKAAYNCDNMADRTIWAHASRLKADDKVRAWLEAAKKHTLVQRVYGLQEHMRDLEDARDLAEKTGNVGAYVKATELLGRASGVYVERIQTESSEADMVKILLEMGQPGRELARNLGVELPDSDTNVPEGVVKH